APAQVVTDRAAVRWAGARIVRQVDCREHPNAQSPPAGPSARFAGLQAPFDEGGDPLCISGRVAFLRPKTSRKFSPGFLPISTHAFCANIPGLMSEPAMVAVDLAECHMQGRRIEPKLSDFPKGRAKPPRQFALSLRH